MTRTVWTFEAGWDGTTVVDGTAALAANVGAQQVSAGRTVFSTAAALNGALGLRVNSLAAASAVIRVQPGGGSGTATSNNMAWLFGTRINTTGALADYIGFATFRHAAGNVALLRWQADDSLGLYETNGTLIGLLLPAGSARTVYRWYSFVLNNLSGVYSLRAYTSTGTLINEISGTRTWLSTAEMGPLQFGVTNAPPMAVSIDFDHIIVGLGESAHIPLPLAGAGPDVKAGAPVFVDTGTSFMLDGSASTADGGITGWSWVAVWPATGAPILTGATTSKPTGTAGPVGSVYVYELTVTDGTGKSAVGRVNVLVTAVGGGGGGTPPVVEEVGDLVWTGTAWE